MEWKHECWYEQANLRQFLTKAEVLVDQILPQNLPATPSAIPHFVDIKGNPMKRSVRSAQEIYESILNQKDNNGKKYIGLYMELE